MSSADTDKGDRGKPNLFAKGIVGRVVNIDGNPLLPRRGIVTEPKQINIIDELTKITTPVSIDLGQPECEPLGSGKNDKDGGLGAKADIG